MSGDHSSWNPVWIWFLLKSYSVSWFKWLERFGGSIIVMFLVVLLVASLSQKLWLVDCLWVEVLRVHRDVRSQFSAHECLCGTNTINGCVAVIQQCEVWVLIKPVVSGEVFVFVWRILWAVVGDYFFRNAMSAENWFSFVDYSFSFGVTKLCNFQVSTVVINNDEVLAAFPFK